MYVNDHKREIETLVAEFKGSEFGQITCSRCWAKDVKPDDQTHSEKFVDGLWRRVENPKGRYFANLLKAAGVYGVSERSSGATELTLAISAGVDDPHYVIQLFHDPTHQNGGYKECINDFQEIECGWCKVTVDENLWIRYGWWPDDPDPAATRARDKGEISWDEWERRNDDALQKCEAQGLLEQGYSPPTKQ